MRTILMTILFVLSTISISLAEYQVRVVDLTNTKTDETKRILHIQGDFDEGISNHVDMALNMYKVDEVVLFSPGGLGFEGYYTGNVLSNHEIPVRVAKQTYCLSACAIAFLGGTNYQINDGILGFHKGWVMDAPWKDQNEAFGSGQVAGDFHSYYFVANGFNFELSNKIVNKTDQNSFIVFTNEDDLNKFYVRNDDGETPIHKYLRPTDTEVKVWGLEEAADHLKNNVNISDWKVQNTLLILSNKPKEDK